MTPDAVPLADYPGRAADDVWRRLVSPRGYQNPEPKQRYHLVVIGAGPAGLVTAIAASGLGANIALVERAAMGGDCLNVGCIPSKALLAKASAERDFDRAFEWLREVRASIAEHDSVERYLDAGVDVFLGEGRFVGPQQVAVGSLLLNARRTAITTGARAALPSIKGLSDAQPRTNESIFELERQPKRLAVLGAGPIGCELAQAFALLGSDVHVFEAADRILAKESAVAAARIGDALAADGVQLHLNANVNAVVRRDNRVSINTDAGTAVFDELLVAVGRKPNTDGLNLAAVDVELDEQGLIKVDRYLRTTNKRIFAGGDVCTPRQFTHHADAHARILVQNALFLPTATADKLIIPRVTYTLPELAQIGATPDELAERGKAFDSYHVNYNETDRGRVGGDESGFVELLVERGGKKILGATIVGHDAGEQIAAVSFAMAAGSGIDALGRAVLPYPTRAEAFKRLADQYNRRRLTDRTRVWLDRWFRFI